MCGTWFIQIYRPNVHNAYDIHSYGVFMFAVHSSLGQTEYSIISSEMYFVNMSIARANTSTCIIALFTLGQKFRYGINQSPSSSPFEPKAFVNWLMAVVQSCDWRKTWNRLKRKWSRCRCRRQSIVRFCKLGVGCLSRMISSAISTDTRTAKCVPVIRSIPSQT